MIDEFKELLRSKKVKHPTARGFTLLRWEAAWENVNNKGIEGEQLFVAGRVFFDLFEEIRAELGGLYQSSPNVMKKKLLMAYCAISNRERYIIDQRVLEDSTPHALHTTKFKINDMGDDVGADELIHSCVDGFQKAISVLIKRKEELSHNNHPIAILEFLKKEAELSQLYGIYEEYWRALLWGDYDFVCHDEGNKVFEVIQRSTSNEIAYELSQERKSKLGEHRFGMNSYRNEIEEIFPDDNYIEIIGGGKKKRYEIKKISNAEDSIKYYNNYYRSTLEFLKESFPIEFFEKEYLCSGFTLNDVLEVFRVLSILSRILITKFSSNSGRGGLLKLSTLLSFCPKYNKNNFIKYTARAIDIPYGKTAKIIDFLTYKGDKGDLWCNPVIDLGENDLTFLISSLVTPVMERVVEHWFVSLECTLKYKGGSYEGKVLSEINEALRNNKIIMDYDLAQSKNIKVNKCMEEVDLIARIGRVVIIGEAKSVVTADSTVSCHNMLKTLDKASRQIRRKKIFVEDNIEDIFTFMDWSYNKHIEYEIVSVIINSSKIYTGLPILGVPVCDEDIISGYFRSNIVPICSMLKNDKLLHYAWHEIYNDFESLQNNIINYFTSPPQISRTKKFLEYNTSRVPCLHDGSSKIMYTRLAAKDLSITDVLTAKSIFPIKKVSNFSEVMAGVEAVM